MPRCAPAPSLRTEPQNRTRRACRLLVRAGVWLQVGGDLSDPRTQLRREAVNRLNFPEAKAESSSAD